MNHAPLGVGTFFGHLVRLAQAVSQTAELTQWVANIMRQGTARDATKWLFCCVLRSSLRAEKGTCGHLLTLNCRRNVPFGRLQGSAIQVATFRESDLSGGSADGIARVAFGQMPSADAQDDLAQEPRMDSPVSYHAAGTDGGKPAEKRDSANHRQLELFA